MKKLNRLFWGMVFSLFLILVSIPAGATSTLDFGVISPTFGTISYDGSGGPLVGTNIQVDNVVGLDTLFNNNTTANLINGQLNFTTGNLTSNNSNSWNFGGGQSTGIYITGGVDFNSDGDCSDVGEISGGTPLLWGTFGNASVFDLGDRFDVSVASFFNSINSTLLNFYGLSQFSPDGSPLPYQGNFNISFQATGESPNAFSSNRVLSGDVTTAPVPEPATMLLLGSGLIGMGFFARKRFKK